MLFTNTNRMTGLSGIDVDSMVRQIMMAESQRLHRFQRQRISLQWRQQDYRSVTGQLNVFRERFLLTTGSDAMRMGFNMQARNTAVAGNNLTATAGTTARPGIYQVQVDQLATRHRLETPRDVSTPIRGTSPISLATLAGLTAPLAADGSNDVSIRISLNGQPAREISLRDGFSGFVADLDAPTREEFEIFLNDRLYREFGRAAGNNLRVSAAFDGDYITFDTYNRSDTITLTNGLNTGLATLGNIRPGAVNNLTQQTAGDLLGTGVGGFFEYTPGVDNQPVSRVTIGGQQVYQRTMQINGVDITLHSGMSITAMNNAINNSGAGVTMHFSALTNTFSLTSDREGAGGRISFENFDDTGFANFLINMNLIETDAGQNAMIRLTTPDSITPIFIERDTNSFTVEGLALNLISVTDPGSPVTITVTEDIDRARTVITNFVEEYNRLVRELNEIRATERPRGSNNALFDPLLDHERREMSESEIRAWEEQARIGMLHRSGAIQRTLDEMRRTISQGIELEDGREVFLFSFGMSIQRDGTIELNEEALDAAMQNFSPAGVHAVFRDLAIELEHVFRRNENRIINMAGREGVGGLNHGTLIERQIRDIDDRIASMEQHLARRETALFAQFARMEAAIMQSSAQMDFLFMMTGM